MTCSKPCQLSIKSFLSSFMNNQSKVKHVLLNKQDGKGGAASSALMKASDHTRILIRKVSSKNKWKVLPLENTKTPHYTKLHLTTLSRVMFSVPTPAAGCQDQYKPYS